MPKPHNCKICDEKIAGFKKLSEHIKKAHKISSLDYYVNHNREGVRPLCRHCGQETRFVSLSRGFKQFCPNHARIAESIAGKNKTPKSIIIKNMTKPSPLRQGIVDYVTSLGSSIKVEPSIKDTFPDCSFDVSIWIPSKKLAIDVRDLGMIRNEESDVFDRKLSRYKFLECKKLGIKLIQIFSDEWMNSNEVCKSMISHSLGKTKISLNARDCDVKLITARETKPFLKESHVSGPTNASYHFGLFHFKEGLVSVVTVRIPIQKKWGKVAELARMATKPNVTVRGSASKLLEHVKKLTKGLGYEGVLSYAELRFGEGKVYENCGFTLAGESMNNYWYTDGTRRYDRFKYRAQPGKTEKIVAIENGVRSVWGCGNNIYVLKF